MTSKKLPKLEPHCNSWIVVDPRSGRALCELYNRKNAQGALDAGLTVITTARYLGELNQKIKRKEVTS